MGRSRDVGLRVTRDAAGSHEHRKLHVAHTVESAPGLRDGGNEVGFGAIYSEALELVPLGRDCGCPCGGGIICTTATELLFPAAVSNFGAYAVACALGVLVGRPAVCPQPDHVGSAIAAAIGEGCVDGGTFYPHVLADDGIPLKGVEHVVGVMRTIVDQTFRSTPRTG